jgi:hypothetical protein
MLHNRHVCRERWYAVEGKSNGLKFAPYSNVYPTDLRAEKGVEHPFRCVPSPFRPDKTCYLDW